MVHRTIGKRTGVRKTLREARFAPEKFLSELLLEHLCISAKDYRGALKILENPKRPLPQKRQVMRNSFGDYRAKMAKEESKFKLEVSISASGKDGAALRAAKFVKRKSNPSKSPHDDGGGGGCGGEGFKFNFDSENASDRS